MKRDEVKVWDLPIRLFHWSLLLSVTYSWFSIKVLEDMQQHFYAGYVVLTLLLFRIVWGFIGSPYAKFYSFVFPVSELVAYIKQFPAVGGRQYLGHNPLGGLSTVAIIGVLMLQVALGLFSSDDYFFAPLTGLVSDNTVANLSDLHSDNVTLIYAVLGLHVFAILYYKLRKKQALTKSMITGFKSHSEDNLPQQSTVSNWLALLVLIVCIPTPSSYY